jgi:sugar O-acyltransferase (sialic acid O-acetyltransferase NeuD family)
MIAPDQLVIFGAGGAGMEALWVARRMLSAGVAEFAGVGGFADDNPQLTGRVVDGVPVLGTAAQLVRESGGDGLLFHCAVGNNRQRQRLAEAIEAAGGRAVALVDPSAIMAETARVDPGTYVGPLSIIAPHARVGRHVLVNTHVGVGHHAVVGDYAQLCPGVRVSGGCRIDAGAFLGSNAVVHPGQTIGEGASIGANSFVIRSVKPRFSMLGVPARIVSRPAENGPDAQS